MNIKETVMSQNFIIYLVVINIIAFLAMGIDKRRSQKKEWRISEKALLGLAFIGGSVGAILGMYVFRHKTKKIYFHILFYVALVLQIIGIWYAIVKL